METLYITEKEGKTYLFVADDNSKPFILHDMENEGYKITNIVEDIQKHKCYHTSLKIDTITETSYSNMRGYIFNVVTCPKYPIANYGLLDYNKERLIATKQKLLQSTSKENLTLDEIIQKHLEIFNNPNMEIK